ncbi:MAG: MATE family efflux transporter [Treponema sp.]|nr:MATE family efflux transporter [Treponema sp.]
MTLSSLFGDKQFYRSLFAVAMPIALQNLVNAFVNMVDTVMVGRLGTVEIAAVGLANNFFFLYQIILFGVSSGGSIFTAQFWGKRDLAGIKKNTGFCLSLNLGLSLLFAFVSFLFPETILSVYSRDPHVIAAGAAYLKILAFSFTPFAVAQVFTLSLRSIEEMRLPMLTTLVALSINVVLNYIFIFGFGPVPAMGVAGAAAATVAARVVEAILLLVLSYRRRYAMAGSFREMTAFNSAYVFRFIRICLPVILNELAWSSGITVENIIFARTHTDAIAAFNITGTVSQLTWVFFMGLGNGVAVLIGKKIGERQEEAARDYAARIIRFAPIVSFAAAFILIPLSHLLPFIFNVNVNVLASAKAMLAILACSYPFRAFNMAMVIGICRAGGDTVFCAIYDAAFLWTVAIPLAAVMSFVFGAPVWVLYICVNLEEVIKAAAGLWRYRSGRWLHNVTEGI